MKKVILMVAVFAMTATAASAQWFAGGGLGVNYSKAGENKFTTFSLTPQVGYMLNDNWGLTLDAGVNYAKLDDGVDSDNNATTFGVGLGVVYFKEIAKNFYFAPSARAYFNSGDAVSFTFAGETAYSKGNQFGLEVNLVGFEFRPSECLGLTVNFGGVGFSSTKEKDASESALQFGLNLFDRTMVGVRYYF